MNSVCMASFNGERYIKEQIDSILLQIGEDDELIISDDGSTDQTVDVICSYRDDRIKFVRNVNRHGCIGNFENALRVASGDFIFLADQDDIWLSDEYTKMCTLLEQYDLVVSDSVVVDSNLNVIEPSFFNYFHSGMGIMKNIIKSSYYGSCMAFRKTLLYSALPFPLTNEIGHDLWLGLVAEMTGRVYFFNKPLILYRRHETAFCKVSKEENKNERSLLQKLVGRIVIIKELIAFRMGKKRIKS